MLAYSSIGHAGYVLLGIIAVNEMGLYGVLVYSVVYVFATLGIWATVLMLAQHEYAGEQIEDFEGLHRRAPLWAFAMFIFLLSLGGIPPTAGFIGKWYIFAAAIQEGHYWLAIIGVLTSVVSVFFYLRIVVMMYMTEGPESVRPRVPAAAMAGLALAVVAVLYLGILPTRVLDIALDSISTIF
jgi:NADH-quinone oxidoreductase subunit N